MTEEYSYTVSGERSTINHETGVVGANTLLYMAGIVRYNRFDLVRSESPERSHFRTDARDDYERLTVVDLNDHAIFDAVPKTQ